MKWKIQLQESNVFKRQASWVSQCTGEETRGRIEDIENKNKDNKAKNKRIKELQQSRTKKEKIKQKKIKK